MGKSRKVVYGTRKLFYAFDFFRLRLIPCRRYQKVFYKIAVTNRNNRIIEFVGFINPHAVPLRLSYRDLENFFFETKQIGLDRSRIMFWLSKRVLTTPTVFFLLFEIGLIKTYFPLSVGRYSKLFLEYVEVFCSKLFKSAYLGENGEGKDDDIKNSENLISNDQRKNILMIDAPQEIRFLEAPKDDEIRDDQMKKNEIKHYEMYEDVFKYDETKDSQMSMYEVVKSSEYNKINDDQIKDDKIKNVVLEKDVSKDD